MQKSRPANRRLALSSVDGRYLKTWVSAVQFLIGQSDVPTGVLGSRRLIAPALGGAIPRSA
jgi:hypothetical protein